MALNIDLEQSRVYNERSTAGALRSINKRLGRKGRVVEDRYHLEVLRTPTQVRNAVRYVLRNGEKHGVHVGLRHGDWRPCPDPLSSAAWYGYWKEGELNVLATQSAATVVRPAQCFLLKEGLLRVERASLLDAPPTGAVIARRPSQTDGTEPAQSPPIGRHFMADDQVCENA